MKSEWEQQSERKGHESSLACNSSPASSFCLTNTLFLSLSLIYALLYRRGEARKILRGLINNSWASSKFVAFLLKRVWLRCGAACQNFYHIDCDDWTRSVLLPLREHATVVICCFPFFCKFIRAFGDGSRRYRVSLSSSSSTLQGVEEAYRV